MKYLIINGSPRKQGYTSQILKLIQQNLSPSMKGEWVDINDLTIKPCSACYGCRPNKECVFPEDDGHRLGRLIYESDFLIIGSPTYWGNMSGALKVLMDRSLTVFESLPVDKFVLPKPNHKEKKAVIVSSCNAPCLSIF
ncbi:MAG: flavodoxin family protein [Spirochaetes bacterium]|nr:flavodoxin family protein [Spirochaetota bacterium]